MLAPHGVARLGWAGEVAVQNVSNGCLRYFYTELFRHHKADAHAAVAGIVCVNVNDNFFN